MEYEQQDEGVNLKRRPIGDTDRIISFEGPNGKIEIVAVKRENSTAVSDLYDTIAGIMIKQARKEFRIQK
ncbi:hypothetical protein D3C74_375290 [compost metagenome]